MAAFPVRPSIDRAVRKSQGTAASGIALFGDIAPIRASAGPAASQTPGLNSAQIIPISSIIENHSVE
jgi:hypothetical protein